MPVPYTFSPNTKIKSSEVNANFTSITDGSAFTGINTTIKFNNNVGIRFKNADNSDGALIYEDTSNYLKFESATGQGIAFSSDQNVNFLVGGKKIVIFDSTGTKSINLYHDATNGFISVSSGNLRIVNKVILNNATGYYVQDSGGTARRLLSLDANNILQLGRLGRKGGSATNWNVSGTTSYTSNDFTIQIGVWNIPDNSTSTYYFHTPFSATPFVIFDRSYNDNYTVYSDRIYRNNTGTGAYTERFIAIGPV